MNKYKKRSTDLRELIIFARINGKSYGEISKKFHISKQGAMEIFRKFQKTGFVENLERTRSKTIGDTQKRFANNPRGSKEFYQK